MGGVRFLAAWGTVGRRGKRGGGGGGGGGRGGQIQFRLVRQRKTNQCDD